MISIARSVARGRATLPAVPSAASPLRAVATVVLALTLAGVVVATAAAAGPLSIQTDTTTVSRQGLLSIRAHCASAATCRGAMTVRAFGRVIGRSTFAVRGRGTGYVVARIDARARRELALAQRARATATLVARYATTARYVTIVAPAGGFSG